MDVSERDNFHIFSRRENLKRHTNSVPSVTERYVTYASDKTSLNTYNKNIRRQLQTSVSVQIITLDVT